MYFLDPSSLPVYDAVDVGNNRRYDCSIEKPGTPAVQLQIKVRTYQVQTRRAVTNPFIPAFLKWTQPSLNLNMSTDTNRVPVKNRMANSVDPDGTTRYESV